MLKIKSGVKAGGLSVVNHGQRLKVRSGLKAGGLSVVNHGHRLARRHSA